MLMKLGGNTVYIVLYEVFRIGFFIFVINKKLYKLGGILR